MKAKQNLIRGGDERVCSSVKHDRKLEQRGGDEMKVKNEIY